MLWEEPLEKQILRDEGILHRKTRIGTQKPFRGGANIAPPCPPLMCYTARIHKTIKVVKRKKKKNALNISHK